MCRHREDMAPTHQGERPPENQSSSLQAEREMLKPQPVVFVTQPELAKTEPSLLVCICPGRSTTPGPERVSTHPAR